MYKEYNMHMHMEALFILSLAVLLFLIYRINSKVDHLEQIIKSGSAASPQTSTQSNPTATPQPTTPPPPVSIPRSSEPAAINKLFAWIKDDWLLKLGALLLLIAFGWFATYAFLNNWIGPLGRIALGIIAGISILALGWWRIRKYVHQGAIFTVLGSTVILLTIFAAREIYDFFNPATALSVMFISTALVALISVKYRVISLAISSIVLAGIAPLLTNSPDPNYIALFSYLMIIVLGTIWITTITKWRELTAVSLILIAVYSLPHLLSMVNTDRDTLLLFTYGFATLFFLTNTIGILKHKKEEIIPDLYTAAGNGLLLLAWIIVAAPDQWTSLIIAFWMIIFTVGAFVIFRITRRREPFYVYAGIGVVMLAAATAVELGGAALTIAYAIESGLVSLIAYLMIRRVSLAERLSLLMIGPIILSFENITSNSWRIPYRHRALAYTDNWMSRVFHQDFFVLLILAATLIGLGIYYWQEHRQKPQPTRKRLHIILIITGSIYIHLLIWLSLHAALINNDIATMISLVIFTIIGLVTYFLGLMKNIKPLRVYGGIVLGLVVARLLLIDVWDMDLIRKIITFFSIGALLAGTAFISKAKSLQPPSSKSP